MRPSILHVGNTLYWVIRTRNPDTMVLKDADSTPTVAVRKNGASVGDSVTVTKRAATTGIYDCSYNPAGEAEGDSFTLEESVTITGTTTSSAMYASQFNIRVMAIERGTDSAATSSDLTVVESKINVIDTIVDGIALDTQGITDTLGSVQLAVDDVYQLVLAKLDVAISVIQSQITALNNLSAKANWFGYPLLEIPDSGNRAYAFELVVRDDEDKLVNLDGSPTIALTNAAGTDRSALITTGVANPSTGRYTITITVSTSTNNESLKLTATGTVSGETRYAAYGTQVVDYDTATLVNQILTTLGTNGSGLTAIGDARLANLDATISSRASQTSVNTIGTNVDTLLSRITTTVSTLWANLTAMITGSGASAKFTTTALENAPAGGGGGGSVDLDEIKGAGWDSSTDTLEKIRDAISLVSSISVVIPSPVEEIIGMPETLEIGDSYDGDTPIKLYVRDENDDPVTSFAGHDFTDGDFAPTFTIAPTPGSARGRVVGTVTWIPASGPDEGYLKVEIPSSQSRRAVEGESSVQCVLKWDGYEKSILTTTVRWLPRI